MSNNGAQPYPRPELTPTQRAQCVLAAGQLTGRGRTMAQIRQAIIAIVAENIRLTSECNQHREARGLEPIPTYEVRL